MALSGIRDMSTIEQPPFERQPIETYVLEYDEGIVSENDKPSLSDFFFRLLDFGVRKLGDFKRVYLVAYTPYLHAAEA